MEKTWQPTIHSLQSLSLTLSHGKTTKNSSENVGLQMPTSAAEWVLRPENFQMPCWHQHDKEVVVQKVG